MQDIIVVGGGLSGLVSSILLAKGGLQVTLIEKKSYPLHRVCGEYISNEVLDFLQELGINPFKFGASKITNLEISSVNGQSLKLPLGMGGFGLSRFVLDYQLFLLAKSLGVNFLLKTQVNDVIYKTEHYQVITSSHVPMYAKFVIGSYGKRSNLDRQFGRKFFTEKSPYLGVKYHIEIDFPHDLIALHIFKNGYCGLSKVEGNAYCLCYLTLRDNLKNHANIGEMESNVLSKNPFLKDIFKKAKFLYDKPEVINEISFAKKTCIEKGIPMAGDAVGMISPLCGNGMAIAIHSAKILGEIILKNWDKKNRIPIIESHYQQQWKSLFQKRIWAGRKIQDIFGNELLTNTSIFLLKQMKPVAKYLIQQTHGKKI